MLKIRLPISFSLHHPYLLVKLCVLKSHYAPPYSVLPSLFSKKDVFGVYELGTGCFNQVPEDYLILLPP